MKRILMIAYHFPPLAGSSGIQRTLRFVQHLPALGWQPLVLTVNARAYERVSDDLLDDIPVGTVVNRAFALNTSLHLKIAGRYMAWMARPDRWVTWRFDGVRQGLKMIEQYKPDVIWSTYPIATAHVIAATLSRKTGIPWVADFRDPMVFDDYPEDARTRQSYARIEATAAARASYCVLTTPGAATQFKQRYPAAADRMVVLENGYDEESFAVVGSTASNTAPQPGQPLILLHSGIVYPSERDPTQLFVALQRLQASGALGPSGLRIRFRASVHDDLLQALAMAHDVQDFIELCPPIAYRDALAEMMTVDALLVMQASNCNAQIPAKIYEYLRAGRPILALTDPAGDTAGVMRGAGLDTIARLDSADEIAIQLTVFVQAIRDNKAAVPDASFVTDASRRSRSEMLGKLLKALSKVE